MDVIFEALDELPRWARVAFAARCARRVVPLFTQAWANADGTHCRAIEGAIGLAEESAAAGRAAVGLLEAGTAAATAATAAGSQVFYGTLPPEFRNKNAPRDRASAQLAQAVAAAAEWAAETARLKRGVTRAAWTTYRFARQAAEAAGEREMLRGMEADLARLVQLARERRWRPATRVPGTVFDPIS
jgi:hypothetical protein